MLQPDNSFVMVFAYAKTTPSPSGAELQVKQMLERPCGQQKLKFD